MEISEDYKIDPVRQETEDPEKTKELEDEALEDEEDEKAEELKNGENKKED